MVGKWSTGRSKVNILNGLENLVSLKGSMFENLEIIDESSNRMFRDSQSRMVESSRSWKFQKFRKFIDSGELNDRAKFWTFTRLRKSKSRTIREKPVSKLENSTSWTSATIESKLVNSGSKFLSVILFCVTLRSNSPSKSDIPAAWNKQRKSKERETLRPIESFQR